MKLDIEVIGKVVIVKEVSDSGESTLCAGSPRECGQALALRFKMLLAGERNGEGK